MNISVIWWVVVALSTALALTVLLSFQLYDRLQKELFRKRSLSVKYGKLTEQFLPLADSFPWNPEHFRFLGSPIDGIQFEHDQIVLVEFKSAKSQLSTGQRHIRDLVNNGRVKFEVIRIK